MRFFLNIVVALLVLSLSCSVNAKTQAGPASSLVEKFKWYQTTFQKTYASEAHQSRAFEAFRESYEQIVANHNNPEASFRLDFTEFSDIPWEQFKQQYLDTVSLPQDCSATAKYRQKVNIAADKRESLPRAWDWRPYGVVAPVKNQGRCGSCYAFSSTGAIESAHAIKHSQLIIGSEQEIVSCLNGTFNNHGCNGGLPSYVFNGIKAIGGMMTNASYPYTAGTGHVEPCQFDKKYVFTTIVDEYNITEADEYDLVHKLVSSQPISVAYEVVSDFRNYRSGIYSSTLCKNGAQDLNHAVLLTGIGEDISSSNGPKCYYEIKNSWGSTWGVDGYFWMERDCRTTHSAINSLGQVNWKNMCGIATCASSPVVA